MSISLPRSSGHGYLRIAASLRSAITTGELAAGEQLPAIGELARRFQSTAITVRRALRLLEEEGLVRVRHGVGTFVADWSRHDDPLLAAEEGGPLPGFAQEMAARRLTVATEVLSRARNVTRPAVARALGLEPGAPLSLLERLRRVEGLPVVFQRSYLPGRPHALGEVVERCAATDSLYSLVRELTGRAPLAAEERLRALPLPPPAAAALEALPHSPGWRSLRLTTDVAGAPLLYDEAYFPADRVEPCVTRRAGQALLRLEVLPLRETPVPPDPESSEWE